MRVFDVRTISYRTWDDAKWKQLPVYNLVRVQAESSEVAKRKACSALEGYALTKAIDAVEVKGVWHV